MPQKLGCTGLADLRGKAVTNISATSLCNRSCDYCFAGPVSDGPGHMEADIFEQALGHVGRSGLKQVRLLGGEPTIHPRFSEFLDAIEDRGLSLLLFSNGLMPRKAIERLGRFPGERLSILLNTHCPDTQPERETKRFRLVCRELGSRIMLGRNVHGPNVALDFMLPLIGEFGLLPEIRVGLAHPRFGAENVFLHPRHYRHAGGRLGAFARLAKSRGVKIEFDCGFVPCMFAEDDLRMFAEWGEIPGKRCNPLPDFLPDGRFIPCYPLADAISMNCHENSTNDGVQAFFGKKLESFRRAGIFKQCQICELRQENICNGGCLAVAMTRLRHIPFAVDRKKRHTGLAVMEEDKTDLASGKTTATKLWAIPYIDRPLSFWREISDRFGPSISEVYVPLPMVPTGRPAQKTEYLDGFLRDSPLPVSVLVNPMVLPEPVHKIAPVLIGHLRQSGLKRATVADYALALRIREALPDISLTASVLMDIARPHQAMLLNGVFDVLVPASRIMRDYDGLAAIRQAFDGKIRLVVNEACLPDCLFRTQHFYEMAYSGGEPRSPCQDLLERNPWLRLTGAWVLPRHLHFYDDIVDEFKLAGRVTLRDPKKYVHVLASYITRSALPPNQIGGGPASVLSPLDIREDFYRKTLYCKKQCHNCEICKKYFVSA